MVVWIWDCVYALDVDGKVMVEKEGELEEVKF